MWFWCDWMMALTRQLHEGLGHKSYTVMIQGSSCLVPPYHSEAEQVRCMMYDCTMSAIARIDRA